MVIVNLYFYCFIRNLIDVHIIYLMDFFYGNLVNRKFFNFSSICCKYWNLSDFGKYFRRFLQFLFLEELTTRTKMLQAPLINQLD